jgi:hypothetical protein
MMAFKFKRTDCYAAMKSEPQMKRQEPEVGQRSSVCLASECQADLVEHQQKMRHSVSKMNKTGKEDVKSEEEANF